MKKQKQIVTSFFNQPLNEAYLNINQNAFKHNMKFNTKVNHVDLLKQIQNMR